MSPQYPFPNPDVLEGRQGAADAPQGPAIRSIGGTPSARSKRIGLHRVFDGIETAARDDIVDRERGRSHSPAMPGNSCCLSRDGAHATLGAFVRHMKQGNDGEPDAFFFGPDIAGMASTLLSACVAVTELIGLAVSHMGREEEEDAELRDLKLQWHIIRHDLEARAATENDN
jgi:hypothetical protein